VLEVCFAWEVLAVAGGGHHSWQGLYAEWRLEMNKSLLVLSFQVLVQVGISSVWYEGNTCNMHLLDLAEEVKAGVEDAGMVAYRFNTIGVSDAISMGTDGMSYSLQSQDLIADKLLQG
jgi:dihydroxyacid dehydratase/phosphogluconate dehydratase